MVLGLALLPGTSSQAHAQKGLKLGFRGGVSVASASVDVSETFDKNNRIGFQTGCDGNGQDCGDDF